MTVEALRDPVERHPSDGSSERWPVKAIAGVLSLAIAFYGVFIWRASFELADKRRFSLFDDAMVSMTYARNLAEGHGLRWNATGDAVEGYTNLLWTLWMAALHLVGLSGSAVALSIQLTGVVLLVLTSVAAGALARSLGGSSAAIILAVAGTAFYYPLAFWTLRGMEVGLIALVLTSSCWVTHRLWVLPRAWTLSALCGLIVVGVLTRTDTALPLAVVLAFAVWGSDRARRLKIAAITYGTLIGTLILHSTFRLLYYGSLTPNTYALKVEGVPTGSRVERGLAAFLELFSSHLWGVAIGLAAFMTLVRPLTRLAAMLGAVAGMTIVFSIYVGGDAWEWMGYSNRYIAASIPLLMCLAALGVVQLVRRGPTVGLLAATILVGTAGYSIAEIRPFASSPLGSDGLGGSNPSFGPLIVVGLLMVASLIYRSLHSSRYGAAAIIGTAFVVAYSTNGAAYTDWKVNAGVHVREDEVATAWGLRVREATLASARIAVVWAGAIPYNGHRSAIDLLGKSDSKIAHGPSHTPFWPGHSKWDYTYSIGQLQPDLVIEHSGLSEQGYTSMMSAWGYQRVGRGIWIRANSVRVDPAVLVGGATTAPPMTLHARSPLR